MVRRKKFRDLANAKWNAIREAKAKAALNSVAEPPPRATAKDSVPQPPEAATNYVPQPLEVANSSSEFPKSPPASSEQLKPKNEKCQRAAQIGYEKKLRKHQHALELAKHMNEVKRRKREEQQQQLLQQQQQQQLAAIPKKPNPRPVPIRTISTLPNGPIRKTPLFKLNPIPPNRTITNASQMSQETLQRRRAELQREVV